MGFRKQISVLVLASCLSFGSVEASEALDKTLYDRLGGDPTVTAVVKGMLAYSLDDPRISEIFSNSNLERLEELLINHLCDIADGPCTYEGQHMRVAHHGLGIESMHFNALVENMQKAMDDEGISFSTQNKLLARLAPMHDDVTERTPIPSRTP
jgi:hemoglobin